ncbi:hypothetical protein JKP88DRAFT_247585 [Tribonema minus]|uniref:MYND-type domain-containing protein n=1 Tax=Tribonema minus TaxID=303371 RepID=A0A836CB97_9STRA|nr:hypothetical protein JKP88DRAFT_247585 [Tribonema minus]
MASVDIDAVAECMRRMPSDFNMQFSGMSRLSFVSHCPESWPKIARAGGCEVLIQAMATHSDSAELQRLGCYEMAELAGEEENLTSIHRAGADATVVKTMLAHPSIESIQAFGTCSLALLTKLRDSRVLLSSVEGREVIFAAMSAFSNSTVLQGAACSAVANLAMDGEDRETLLALGARQLIEAAVAQFSENSVQTFGKIALGNLGIEGPFPRLVAQVDASGLVSLPPAAALHTSNRCAARGCDAAGTKRCGRCRVVKYCSKTCQAGHWAEHKRVCESLN